MLPRTLPGQRGDFSRGNLAKDKPKLQTKAASDSSATTQRCQEKTKQNKQTKKLNKRGSKWLLRCVKCEQQGSGEKHNVYTATSVRSMCSCVCVLMRVYPVMRGCVELLPLHSRAGRSVLICSTAGDDWSSIMMTVCDLLCFSASVVSVSYIACLPLYMSGCFVFLFLYETQNRVQFNQGPRSPLSSPPSLLVQLHQISGGNSGNVQHRGFR